jgi:Xaa-Pro aminopeptidase
MLSHEKAMSLNAQLAPKNSKLAYPPQNLIDLLWKDKPSRSKKPIYVQPDEFTGMHRGLAGNHPVLILYRRDGRLGEDKCSSHMDHGATSSYPVVFEGAPDPGSDACWHIAQFSAFHRSVLSYWATAVTDPSAPAAYLLNLRGADIPYNPVFQSYLYIGLDMAVLFIERAKVEPEVQEYLNALGVETRDYNNIWQFLRKREYGEGKVLINPQTSYALSLMLTHLRYTVAPSFVDEMKAVKNETELEGMRHAYMRDGAAFVSLTKLFQDSRGLTPVTGALLGLAGGKDRPGLRGHRVRGGIPPDGVPAA